MTIFYVKNKNNETFRSDNPAAARKAVSEGYQLISQAEYDASKQTLRAGVEGAARAATLGLSDYLQDPEGLRLRQEANPTAALTGEIIGSFAPTGAAGKAAKAVGVLQKGIAGAAGREAINMGVLGLGKMISDEHLDNSNLTADQIASTLAKDALVGAGFGAAFGTIGKGASALMKKFGGEITGKGLTSVAEALDEKALTTGNLANVKKLIKRKGGSVKEAAEWARENHISLEYSPENLDKARAVLDNINEQVVNKLQVLDNVDPLGNAEFKRRFIDSVADRVRERFKGDLVAKKEVENVLAEHITSRKADASSWSELFRVQSRMREAVESTATGIKRDVYDVTRKELRDAIFKQAENAGVASKDELMQFQKSYAKGKFVEAALESKVLRNEASPMFNMLDAAVFGAGALAGGPLGAAAGLAFNYGKGKLRELGPGVLATSARKIGESQALSRVGKGLFKHVSRIAEMAPDALGVYRQPLIEALALGEENLLAEHTRLAGGSQGDHYLSVLGLERENEREVQAMGRRAAYLDVIDETAQGRAAQMNTAIDGLLSGKRGKLEVTPMDAKSFKAISESIQKKASDYTVFFEQIPPELQAASPGVANEIALRLLKTNQFLESKIPKNPYANLPKSMAQDWKPNAVEVDRFNRYYEAVTNPAKVLKNMANGYISPEQADAVKSVYPDMFEELRHQLNLRLHEQKKPLSYQQRLAVSQIIGPQALAMKPKQVQILQQINKPQQTPEQKTGGDGRQKVDVEKNLQTQSQRLEGR